MSFNRSTLVEKGLDHVAETVLSYLDAKSLCSAELVCKEWYRVISEGMLWKKLIESRVRTDTLWKGLAHRRGWFVPYIHFLSIELLIKLILILIELKDSIPI
jgi:hypothetical protein